MSDLKIIAKYDLGKLREEITPLFTGLDELNIVDNVGRKQNFKSADELIAATQSGKRFSLFTNPGGESIGYKNRSVIDYYRMCKKFFPDPFEFLAFIELKLTKRFSLLWCGDIERDVIVQSHFDRSIYYSTSLSSSYYISPIKAYILKLRLDRIGKID